MYIKLHKNDFTRKMMEFDTLKKLPKNVGDLGKLIVAKGLKKSPKSNKSPNLVTLISIEHLYHSLTLKNSL